MNSSPLRNHTVTIRKSVETLYAYKINRNGLCYCGSGKKFKKCHLDEFQKKNPFHEKKAPVKS